MDLKEPTSPPMGSDANDASASWFIGRGADCAFQTLSGPPRVAVLSRRERRLFVRDLGAGNQVSVNQTRLAPGAEVEVTRYDQLEVAGAVIELEPRLFLGRTRLGMDTTALFLPRPDGREGWLCEGAFLRAEQGSFTAIMGPAGSGKTVFLNLLNGYIGPSQGRVSIGHSFDLHKDSELLRHYMGYVPQDDVMIAELTVRQSLDFRLRLRFPDMASGVRASLVSQTCARLGFHASRLETFLDTLIGSPELGRRGLSGGERRRANIAHELVMKPAILLLDEPTSGLSSVDAEQVIGLLHLLAREEHLTVVATLHQPGRESFARFDNLMVLSHGGRVVYFGPAASAVSFFERATEEPFAPGDNPAEFVLRRLHEPRDVDRLVRYRAKHERDLPGPLPEAPTAPEDPKPQSRAAPSPDCFGQLWRNFNTLLRRNLDVALADRFSLWLALGQAPLMAALVWLAFAHFSGDAPDLERFNRSLYHFSRNKEPYMKPGGNGAQGARDRPMPVESLFERSREEARTERWMISPQMAQRRGAVYYVLIAAAIWLGVVSGCREIVVEKHVLHREARTCVRIGPYLAAKLAAQVLLTGIQCAMLAVMVAPWLLGMPLFKLAGFWLALWLTAAAAGSLGLMISAMAPTYRAALTAVPLVLIPQLLFGGLMRPHPEMAPGTGLSRAAGWLTLQRWGFESAMAMDPYAAKGVMFQQFLPEAASATDAFEFVRNIDFKDASLGSVFFAGEADRFGFSLPLLILAAETGAFLVMSHLFLTRRLGSAHADSGRFRCRTHQKAEKVNGEKKKNQ